MGKTWPSSMNALFIRSCTYRLHYLNLKLSSWKFLSIFEIFSEIVARQCTRRQPWCRLWAERAAQGRSARPLGPLVKVSESSFENIMAIE
jgi:hypothetical protein